MGEKEPPNGAADSGRAKSKPVLLRRLLLLLLRKGCAEKPSRVGGEAAAAGVVFRSDGNKHRQSSDPRSLEKFPVASRLGLGAKPAGALSNLLERKANPFGVMQGEEPARPGAATRAPPFSHRQQRAVKLLAAPTGMGKRGQIFQGGGRRGTPTPSHPPGKGPEPGLAGPRREASSPPLPSPNPCPPLTPHGKFIAFNNGRGEGKGGEGEEGTGGICLNEIWRPGKLTSSPARDLSKFRAGSAQWRRLKRNPPRPAAPAALAIP